MEWLLPVLTVALGAGFYALWARREGLLARANFRREQLAQLSATLGSLQEAVLIVDAQNRVQLANPALRAIFPDAKQIVGQGLEEARYGAALLRYLDAVRGRQSTPRRAIEFVREPGHPGQRLVGGAGGGASFWLEVAGALMPPLDGGQGAWVLLILHDITHQRRLEALRKDFVANVSHELRTPLSVIMGYVETLVDGRDTIPPQTRQQFLLTIQRHTQRLGSLLDDLLSLSRLESATPGLRSEPVELARLLREVLEDYRGRPLSAAHTLRLEVDPALEPPEWGEPTARGAGEATGSGTARTLPPASPALVQGDPLKLAQALENLIDNALKYTPAGAEILISARLRAPDETAVEPDADAGLADAAAAEVELCVRDNGPGIPAEDLPHIFERFYRVDKGRSRAQGGTGLGLSIVKHMVQLHGGRVWAESSTTPGRSGSAFYFTLKRQAR